MAIYSKEQREERQPELMGDQNGSPAQSRDESRNLEHHSEKSMLLSTVRSPDATLVTSSSSEVEKLQWPGKRSQARQLMIDSQTPNPAIARPMLNTPLSPRVLPVGVSGLLERTVVSSTRFDGIGTGSPEVAPSTERSSDNIEEKSTGSIFNSSLFEAPVIPPADDLCKESESEAVSKDHPFQEENPPGDSDSKESHRERIKQEILTVDEECSVPKLPIAQFLEILNPNSDKIVVFKYNKTLASEEKYEIDNIKKSSIKCVNQIFNAFGLRGVPVKRVNNIRSYTDEPAQTWWKKFISKADNVTKAPKNLYSKARESTKSGGKTNLKRTGSNSTAHTSNTYGVETNSEIYNHTKNNKSGISSNIKKFGAKIQKATLKVKDDLRNISQDNDESLNSSSTNGITFIPLVGVDKSFYFGTNEKIYPIFVPIAVFECSRYIIRNGLKSSGLFRINGSGIRVSKLIKRFETPPNYGLQESYDEYTIYDVADCLKRYLRCLSNCILTSELYSEFIKCLSIPEDHGLRKISIQMLIMLLPIPHALLMDYVISLIEKVLANTDHNKMNPQSLARVFSPNFLTSNSHKISIHDTDNCSKILEYIINNRKEFKIVNNRCTADELSATCENVEKLLKENPEFLKKIKSRDSDTHKSTRTTAGNGSHFKIKMFNDLKGFFNTERQKRNSETGGMVSAARDRGRSVAKSEITPNKKLSMEFNVREFQNQIVLKPRTIVGKNSWPQEAHLPCANSLRKSYTAKPDARQSDVVQPLRR